METETVTPATADGLWAEKFGTGWVPLAEVSEDITWRQILHTLIHDGKVERHEVAAGPVYRLKPD
jgi:hypothetical protein